MRIRDIICEYANNDDSWSQIINWNHMPERMQDRLKSSFADVNDMIQTITGGLTDNVEFKYELGQRMKIDIVRQGAIHRFTAHWDYSMRSLVFQYVGSDNYGMGLLDSWKFFKGIMKFVRKLSIQYLKMLATGDGTYQWTRIGFVPSDGAWQGIKNEIAVNIDKWLDDYPEKQEYYFNLLKSDDPKTIWKLADRKLGKLIFSGVIWSGYFDFNDADCLEQLNKFIRF